MAQNLIRRGAVYYARVSAPKKLQELRKQLGLKNSVEVWKSLRTRDLSVAKRALPSALEAVYRGFEAEEAMLIDAGAKGQSELIVPDEHDFQRAAWEFIQNENRLDEVSRAARPSAVEVGRRVEEVRRKLESDPPKSEFDAWLRPGGLLEVAGLKDAPLRDAERREALATELREHLTNNNFVLVEWALQTLATQRHWHLEKDSLPYKELGRHLLRAWIRALETSFQRDRGIYDEASVTPLPLQQVERELATDSGKPKKGESLPDYLDAFIKEQKQGVSFNRLQDTRATIRQFIECCGNRPVTSYTRADMAQFKRLLSQTPARAEKLYPGLPLKKVIERNRKDGHPILKSNSIRNKLGALTSLGRWLEANVDGVDANNFKTTLPPKNDAARMEPFAAAEISAILNAKAFIGCRSERDQRNPGAHKIRDWRYWLPLILAFTGARLNEIVQLNIHDLQQVDGIWTFAITDRGEGQSLKTSTSARLVPVHPKLLDLGLLSFRDHAERLGEVDLFHEVPVYRDGRRSHHAGKWFRKFLVRVGVKGEGDLGGAHRWRHTLADELRRAGVDDYDIAGLLGHAVDVAKMTGHYGREVSLTLGRKHELISKTTYPSVDFSLLE